MPNGQVLFDARDGLSGSIGFVGLVFLLGLATVLVVLMIDPKQIRGGDLTMNGATIGLGLLVIIGLLLASSAPFVLALWAKMAITGGRASVSQDCVRRFDRQIHYEDHGLTDTYFWLGNRAFHFNSSPWIPGFHDEADTIRPGDGLRITTSGDTVLKIERTPQTCSPQ